LASSSVLTSPVTFMEPDVFNEEIGDTLTDIISGSLSGLLSFGFSLQDRRNRPEIRSMY